MTWAITNKNSTCFNPLPDKLFQPPNFTQVLLQPSSTRSWLKPHPSINNLAIVTALSWQPLAQTGEKAEKTVFSTCLCIGGQHAVSQPRHFESWAQRQPCCLHHLGAPTYLALSAESEPISKGHCRKWHHKMKFSCQIYLATSGKGLNTIIWHKIQSEKQLELPWVQHS